MSQPQVFGPKDSDPFATPLTNIDQLVQLFHHSARTRSDWMIGIEYEMFGQIHNGQKPLPYEGPLSITSFYTHLLKASQSTDDPFAPIMEGDNLVGLSGKRAVIALEPGGQIEIAARPHHRLDDATTSFRELVEEITSAAASLNIELFAVGIHPNAGHEDMAFVKKARYDIMRAHMQGLHGLGLDMMTRSCAIQINLDYENERDLVAKARLGATLVPFYSVLCSSSAFVDGKPANLALARGNVWRKTDPARTGIPALIFVPNFGYEAWINMVLDVPMYFIRRGQTYHDARNASFRQFMAHGFMGHRATVRDFMDHMSTVFTDIRLKPILELRSADSLPVPFVNALTALTWALFYDDAAHQRFNDLLGDVQHQELHTLHNHAIEHGRNARFRDRPVFHWAEQFLNIAATSLTKSQQHHLLAPLNMLVERNQTCAEWISEQYSPLTATSLRGLIKSFSPLNNPLL